MSVEKHKIASLSAVLPVCTPDCETAVITCIGYNSMIHTGSTLLIQLILDYS